MNFNFAKPLSEEADKVYYLPHEGVVVITLYLARVHLLPFVGTEARPFWEHLSVAEHAAVNGARKCRLEHLETCARNTRNTGLVIWRHRMHELVAVPVFILHCI